MEYPQFRKMIGFNRYYKINHEREFIEVTFSKSKPNYSTIQANQYPEMLRIQDMLNNQAPFTEMTNAEIELYFSDQSQ